jgi:hypothetical protein
MPKCYQHRNNLGMVEVQSNPMAVAEVAVVAVAVVAVVVVAVWRKHSYRRSQFVQLDLGVQSSRLQN